MPKFYPYVTSLQLACGCHGGIQLADGILKGAHPLIGGCVLLAECILYLGGSLCQLLRHGAGLVGHPVVAVDLVPVITAALGILPAVQLADDAEAVGDGLVGILPLDLVIPGQISVVAALGLEDFDAALCAKYVFHVISSFLRWLRMMRFRSRTTRSPRNSH